MRRSGSLARVPFVFRGVVWRGVFRVPARLPTKSVSNQRKDTAGLLSQYPRGMNHRLESAIEPWTEAFPQSKSADPLIQRPRGANRRMASAIEELTAAARQILNGDECDSAARNGLTVPGGAADADAGAKEETDEHREQDKRKDDERRPVLFLLGIRGHVGFGGDLCGGCFGLFGGRAGLNAS